MSIVKDKKLKNLMDHWPTGQVATSLWLRDMGISTSLTQRYVKSEWIESIGRGAYKKTMDQVEWYAGLASIQKQLTKDVHLGGPTALAIRGKSHYIRYGEERVFIFHEHHVKLPKWFVSYDWGHRIEQVGTSVFPKELGLKAMHHEGFEINTAGPERAILECLYLAPKRFDLLECYQILESLRTLRPGIMQELLEKCSSIRVKRLFLYMANKANLPVMDRMELINVNLGTGDRVIVKNGVYDSQYRISIPMDLANYD